MAHMPYIENDILMAVMDDDGGAERAKALLTKMSLMELSTFEMAVDDLSGYIAEEIAAR